MLDERKLFIKKYMIIFLTTAVFLCLSIGILVTVQYRDIRRTYNQKLAVVITELRKSYPEITDEKIAAILGKERNPEDRADEMGLSETEEMLKKYSFDPEALSLAQKADRHYRVFLLCDVLLLFLGCLSLFLVTFQFFRTKSREIVELTEMVGRMNQGDYSLEIEKFSEDELSHLRSEIYKTTILFREAAEKAEQDKMHLKDSLSDIAHQMKTPLAAMDILVENSILSTDRKERKKLFEIRKNLKKLEFLVSCTLKLSRFDADVVEMKKEKVALKRLIDGAVENVAPLAELLGVEITVNAFGRESIGADKQFPTSDLKEKKEDRLEEISLETDCNWQIEALTNILKNSVEHEEAGKVEIYARSSGLSVMIDIVNHGQSISEEELPHIFDRFYIGKSSSEDSTGIGLALAKTVIEKSCGKVTVISKEKETVFRIIYFL